MPNRKKFALLCLLVLLFTLPVTAVAQWQKDGTIAKATMVFSEAPGKVLTLIVDWDKSSSCRPTIGLAIADGYRFGSLTKRQKAKEEMRVWVGRKSWSNATWAATYEHATELLSYAPSSLIEALREGEEVQVRIYKDAPIFAFPLDGARAAIDAARKACP